MMVSNRPFLPLKEILNFIFLFISTICVYVLITTWGNIQFGGMDGGVLTNAGWQMYLGYQPYTDFVTGVPPLFLIGAKIAFFIWGIHWWAFVNAAGIFSAIAYIFLFFIFSRLNISAIWKFLTPFTIIAITIVPLSWWWYNPITSIIACLFVSTLLLLKKDPSNFYSQTAFSFFTALLLLSKPNTTIFLFIPSAFYFLINPKYRLVFLKLLVLSISLAFFILFLMNIYPQDLINSYRISGGRLFSITNIFDFAIFNDSWEVRITTIIFIIIIIPCIMSILKITSYKANSKKDWKSSILHFGLDIGDLFIIAICFCTAIAGICTNNSFNMVDLSIFVLVAVFFFDTINKKQKMTWSLIFQSSLLLTGLLLFSFAGITIGQFRVNVKSIGNGLFFENTQLEKIQEPLFFEGVSAGPKLIRTLNDITRVLNENHSIGNRNASVFFGPRIDFGYAAFGIAPTRGLPLWWEAFSDETKQITIEKIILFDKSSFQTCIFLHQDFTFIPNGILQILENKYVKKEIGELTVYYRH